MSKANHSFENPDTRRSEVKKYQDTMMADMGITSLEELSSDEERRRWLKALMPSEGVREKLKDMGYSLYTDDNKRSLGEPEPSSRLLKIASLHRLALETEGAFGHDL